jgi:hypothetical protein
VHAPEQAISPAGHAHAPATQTSPLLHATPQPPQFVASDDRYTQAPLHVVSEVEHAAAQTPLLQTGVEPAQTMPQAPQLDGSLARAAQLVPQTMVPAGHTAAGKSSEARPPHPPASTMIHPERAAARIEAREPMVSREPFKGVPQAGTEQTPGARGPGKSTLRL